MLAVMTDNSDDKNFPPGKRQYTLDFAYHGGIYRDVWMIGKSSVAITDALEADKVAGGGVFVHFDNISGKKAEVYVDTEVHNSGKRTRTVAVETVLADAGDVPVKRVSQQVKLQAGESIYKPVDGRKEFPGTLTAYNEADGSLTVDLNGTAYTFGKKDVALCRLRVEF